MKINPQFSPEKELQQQKVTYNFHLEALRGLAALLVMAGHVLIIDYVLDPGYRVEGIWRYFQAAESAVLLFFILSGYVIGLNHKEHFSGIHVKSYLFKRLVRILPVYIIAIGLGWMAKPDTSFRVVLGNLLMVQNHDVALFFQVPPLPGDTAIWSISYEMLYYLLFIAVWYFRPNLWISFAGLLVLSVLDCLAAFPGFISGYASGLIFWLAGLFIAWKVPGGNPVGNGETDTGKIVPLLLLLVAFHHLSLGKVILSLLHLPVELAQVNIANLVLLPVCILLMLVSTQRMNRAGQWLLYAVLAVLLLFMIYLLVKGKFFETERWVLSGALIGLALVILVLPGKWQPGIVNKPLVFIGKISYSLYLVHMPLLFLIRDYFFSSLSGSPETFLLRCLVWIVICLLLSSFLELVVQPRIRAFFQVRRKIPLAATNK